jgi:hypothetical protein
MFGTQFPFVPFALVKISLKNDLVKRGRHTARSLARKSVRNKIVTLVFGVSRKNIF